MGETETKELDSEGEAFKTYSDDFLTFNYPSYMDKFHVIDHIHLDDHSTMYKERYSSKYNHPSFYVEYSYYLDEMYPSSVENITFFGVNGVKKTLSEYGPDNYISAATIINGRYVEVDLHYPIKQMSLYEEDINKIIQSFSLLKNRDKQQDNILDAKNGKFQTYSDDFLTFEYPSYMSISNYRDILLFDKRQDNPMKSNAMRLEYLMNYHHPNSSENIYIRKIDDPFDTIRTPVKDEKISFLNQDAKKVKWIGTNTQIDDLDVLR